MITLYGNLKTRAFRCYWMAEEAEAPYQMHSIDFKNGDHLTPEFKLLSPLNKVPVLQDGDFALFESAAICNFIGRSYPKNRLVPDAEDHPSLSAAWAKHDQWLYFVMTELEQPLWTMAKHQFALPSEYRVAEMKRIGQYEWAKPRAAIDQHLQNQEYMLFNRFTALDIFVAQTLLWAKSIGIPLESERLETYVKTLKARPAFRKLTGRV